MLGDCFNLLLLTTLVAAIDRKNDPGAATLVFMFIILVAVLVVIAWNTDYGRPRAVVSREAKARARAKAAKSQ